MQLRGLHHVTAICRDLERDDRVLPRPARPRASCTTAPSDDDPESRHVWFGALDGGPGTLVSFMQYPELPTGVVGVGSTHHFALLGRDAPDEQEAWRDYLRGRGVECSDVFDRGGFRSIYLRDPDGHIVEIATRGPGFTGAAGHRSSGRRAGRRRGLAAAPPRRDRRSANGSTVGGRLAAQAPGEALALAVGHRADGLRLGHRDRSEEAAAARATPAVLAHQQIRDRHALRLPWAVEHDVRDGQLACRPPGA